MPDHNDCDPFEYYLKRFFRIAQVLYRNKEKIDFPQRLQI